MKTSTVDIGFGKKPYFQSPLETLKNPENHSGFLLVDKNLPAAKKCQELLDTLEFYDKIVLEGPTGSGKSTQIALALAEAGYKVYVTQPRVLAARSLAEHVREQAAVFIGKEEAKEFIGYATEPETDDHPNNRIQYVTDGKMLKRMLYDNIEIDNTVLIIDEIHEMTVDTELLTTISLSSPIKTIYASATCDVEKTTRYIANNIEQEDVPIISIEGRPYEITEKFGGLMSDEIAKQGDDSKVVLGFVDTKEDVDRMVNLVKAKLKTKGITVLPLHGEQTPDEQRKALHNYKNGKIVIATSVAETSITIPDVDVVVDGGWHRTNGVNDSNKRTLPIAPITKDKSDQRRGRCGRTKEGTYIMANQDGRPSIDWSNLGAYGSTALSRSHLASPIAKIMSSNAISFDELAFYSDIDSERIKAAKNLLRSLGALSIDDRPTEIGRRMAELPLEPSYARMMIEATKYSAEVQLQLATAISATIDSGLLSSKATLSQILELTTDLDQSILFANLSIYYKALEYDDKELAGLGIVVKKLHRAKSKIRSLTDRLDLGDTELTLPDDEQRTQLMACIIAGSEEAFIADNKYRSKDSSGSIVRLSPQLRLMAKPGAILLGQQLLIQRPNAGFNGQMIGTTNVSAEQLINSAPERCDYMLSGLKVNTAGRLVGNYELFFDGFPTKNKITRELRLDEVEAEMITEFIMHDPQSARYSEKIKELQAVVDDLYLMSIKSETPLDIDDCIENIKLRISNAFDNSLHSLEDLIDRLPTISPNEYFSEDQIYEATKFAPDRIIIDRKNIKVDYESGKAKLILPRKTRIPTREELKDLFGDRIVLLSVPRLAGGYRTLDEIELLDSLPPRSQRRSKSKVDSPDVHQTFGYIPEGNARPQPLNTPKSTLRPRVYPKNK